MPRPRTKPKQSRLSFAPVTSHANGESASSSKPDRLANVRYNNPSAPSVVIQPETSLPATTIRQMSPKRKRPADRSSSRELEATISSSQAQDDAEGSGDDEIVAKPRRRLRRGPAPKPIITLDSDSEQSDDPIVSSPAKRRRRNVDVDVPQTPRQSSNQDEVDLEEDLEDLQDSVVKETRTRGRPVDSARIKRQQHLETLRRRRAGNKQQSATEPESQSEEESQESESKESPPESPAHKASLRPQEVDSDVESSIASNEDLDKYDDDFVLADENAELGAPTGSDEIPLEFTRHAYKQTKEYFQDAVEWMVHNQLNPGFPRASPHFKFAFAKLEDEVKGRAGSQLLSSSWSVGFRRALMARPHIEVTAFPVFDQHSCDACNRSGHPASSDIKLYGKAYSLESLEALSEEESDEASPEDIRERDRNGNILPDEGTRFLLGKHCKNMATMAHTLVHWRFHLNEWVTDYLERLGILDDDAILERSRWSQQRKTKFSNETLDRMLEAGEIQKLWRDFHITLKAVRETTSRG